MALTMIRMTMGLFPALMVLSCLWVMRDWNQIRESRQCIVEIKPRGTLNEFYTSRESIH